MEGYTGTILNTAGFSAELKQHLERVISACAAMDQHGMPPIPYLAAWHRNRKRIWYEYASPRFCELLGCAPAKLAECMRHMVVDRREYAYSDTASTRIQEKIIAGQELRSERLDLRQKGVRQGGVDAIYKLRLNSGLVWVKDQSTIVKFPQDQVYLSPGCLTDVTKEMEQKELLERIGYYDELTGLPRRSIMDRILEITVGQFCRGHIDDFCFIIMDIDHFKKINDTYGHQAGDYVLSTMAGVMGNAKRKEDELGRYGGEEFYGLCYGGIETGVEFTERLRRVVDGHRFRWEDNDIDVRFSAGVASARELKNVTEEAMIQLADQRLYMAKEGGRNRTVGAMTG